jgi:hypothetical protein
MAFFGVFGGLAGGCEITEDSYIERKFIQGDCFFDVFPPFLTLFWPFLVIFDPLLTPFWTPSDLPRALAATPLRN